MLFSYKRKLAGLEGMAKNEIDLTFSGQSRTEKDPINTDNKQWFVMRDLTRVNAKMPAHRMLEEKNICCFTPMTWKLFVCHGKRERRAVPFIHDLLFVYDTRQVLDPIVERVSTLQYRYLRGAYCCPMTVPKADMERFIGAVKSVPTPHYYRPEEITPDMLHHRIRIVGGALSGYEGYLLNTRGSKVKRLLVELPSLLIAAVEVVPEYIQILDEE